MPTSNPILWPALYAAAFLAGSIPTGLLIGRAKGIDIRQHGSGNIGATNVTRVMGPGPGALCFAIDIGKGMLPALAAGLVLGRLGQLRMPAGDAWLWLGAMVMPVLGHVFCPWLKFKGGKGVATGLGAMLGVWPGLGITALLAAATWGAVYAARRYVSLASIAAGVMLPVWTLGVFWLWPAAGTAGRAGAADQERAFPPAGSGPFLMMTGAMMGLVIWTHRTNIRRLLAGTELRAGPKKKGASDQAHDPSGPQRGPGL